MIEQTDKYPLPKKNPNTGFTAQLRELKIGYSAVFPLSIKRSVYALAKQAGIRITIQQEKAHIPEYEEIMQPSGSFIKVKVHPIIGIRVFRTA